MKTLWKTTLGLVLASALLAADGKPRGGEFSATAKMETRQGARSLAFNLVVSQPITLEEAQPLKDVLYHGGQQALLNSIRGSARGKIKLGALEYPVDLVVYEQNGDGDKYFVVTARALKIQEVNEGHDSLNYPFSLFVLNVPSVGTGDGEVYTRAELWVDDEGHVRAAQHDGQPGTLRDVKRLK
jgi:hypothetical protein